MKTEEDSRLDHLIMTMKYRDKIEIIMLMLRSSNSDNRSAKTKIMYESFLTFPQLEGYLSLLLRNDLLVYNAINRTYKTSEKGLRLLAAPLSAIANQVLVLTVVKNDRIIPMLKNVFQALDNSVIFLSTIYASCFLGENWLSLY